MKLPKARTENLVEQSLGKETLLYDLLIDKAFNLNETSSIVYNACDGVTTFAELKRKHKFSDDFIYLALDELKKNNLLANDANYVSPHAEMSRREVVKKVGLGTMIALPVIAGLVAPSAANAASSGSLFQTCTRNRDCGMGAPNCNRNGDGGRFCCSNSSNPSYAKGSYLGYTGTTCNACYNSINSFCCSGSSTRDGSCIRNSSNNYQCYAVCK